MIVSIQVNADYLVKTIYFKPNNVDNVPFEKIRGWMNDVQELYIEEMSRHGYGNQSFKLEREHNGNVKINVVDGAHPSWKYETDTWDNIKVELNEKWKNDQRNIHVFIIGETNAVGLDNDCCIAGFGWHITNVNFGGICLIAENVNMSLVRLIAHEMGHTFGLYHTEAVNSFMRADIRGKGLAEYEARWLHKHYFFNDNRMIKLQHPTINQMFSVKEIEGAVIEIRVNITSPNDLYQIIAIDDNMLAVGWQYINGRNTNAKIKIDRSKLINKSHITFMVMDTFGAFTSRKFDYIMPPRPDDAIHDKNVSEPNKNQDLELDKKDIEPITIKEDTSKNVVYLNINSGKKTLPDEDGLKPFNSSREYKNGWGWQAVSDNKTNNGNPIIIRDATFERGISLSPPNHPEVSSLKYNLQGNNYIAFEGYIGITNDRDFEIGKNQNKSCFVGGSCIFTFEIDGQNVYKSGLLTGEDSYEEVDFYIPFDAEVLRIIIDSSADTSWCDHPAIGDPKLISNSQIRYSIKPKGKAATLWGKIKQK